MKLKRDNHCDKGETSSSINPFSPQKISSQANMWEEDDQQRQQQEAPDAGMDELLAEMGYKVKSSDMDEVAQKLEQLDKVMGTSMEDGKNGISHLSDTVHYNPSDLSGWVQSMLSELNNNVNFPISSTSNIINYDEISAAIEETDYTTRTADMIFDDDLRAIPGDAIFFNNNNNNTKNEKSSSKRMKSSSSSPTTAIGSDDSDPRTSDPARPVVLMDSQETGIRLVHTLMACAEAVQQHNFKVADALIKHIGLLAVSQVGAMRKVATYFAEALARRIYKIYPQVSSKLSSESDILQMHFYESCPYLKFAHFTANQAILEAFTGANRVHVIDFALKLGMQWPALLQALALRPGGPPAFRLTGIGPPQPDNTDALQQVGWKLAQLAETIGVEFEFRGYVANSLADIDASMLEVRSEDVEAVAVNSVFELHRLLSRPGRIEKVLNLIKSMKPKIVAIVEQEANHNGNVFLDRFNEALHYYSTMFDSLESSGLTQQSNSKEDLLMSEVYLGQQICNVLACEGADRVERHETLAQWRGRMNSAGFEPVHLGSNAFKQASMLLALFGRGDGYRVEENDGCLMLGWHTRPLIATSAWQIRDGSESL